MTNIINLATSIFDDIRSQEGGESNDYQKAYVEALDSYLIDNVELNGTYTGLVPAVPTPTPDPNNGPHVWSLVSTGLDEGLLQGAAVGGFNPWVEALRLQISLSIFNAGDDNNIITAAPPALLSTYGLVISQDDLRDLVIDITDNESSYRSQYNSEYGGDPDWMHAYFTHRFLAEKIIEYLELTVVPPSVGTSSAGGTGPIVFSTITVN